MLDALASLLLLIFALLAWTAWTIASMHQHLVRIVDRMGNLTTDIRALVKRLSQIEGAAERLEHRTAVLEGRPPRPLRHPSDWEWLKDDLDTTKDAKNHGPDRA